MMHFLRQIPVSIFLFLFPVLELLSVDLPIAKSGILDLSGIQIGKEEIAYIPLDGEWKFYWNEFIDPDPGAHHLLPSGEYIQVPSQWQKERDRSGNLFPTHGYASYSLKVILPPNCPRLSITMSDTGMAYSLFINGVLHAYNGRVAKTKEEMKIKQRYRTFRIEEKLEKELYIVVHNSNFHYYKSGIWQSLKLGETETLDRIQFQNYALDLIIFSALFIMGLYHTGLYIHRRVDRSPLYFGVFCILVALRTVSIKERLIYELIEDLPFYIVHKIEYLSVYFGGFVFMEYIHSIFPEEGSGKIRQFFRYTLIPNSILVVVATMSVYSKTLIMVQIIIIFGIGYTLYLILSAISKERQGAKSFLIGLIVFFVTIVNDILRTRGFLFTPFLASYGLLFFVVSQAIVLSRRFANAFVLSENLSRELQKLSENLEVMVQDRNKELNKTLDVLHKDLFYAKRIQTKSLNIDTTNMKELNILPFYSAMAEVGGDFYGVSRNHSGRYRIFLADVTGHGIQAALITMAVKALYENIKNMEGEPSDVLEAFNSEFTEKYQSLNSLLTCIFLDIYPDKQTLSYASAGHPAFVLLKEDRCEILERTGRMVGITKNNSYSSNQLDFCPGDQIFLFTDGIFEQFNENGEEYGEKRLYQELMKSRGKSPDKIIKSMIEGLEAFLGEKQKQDDITILGIEYK